jgi:hypothetical protein
MGGVCFSFSSLLWISFQEIQMLDGSKSKKLRSSWKGASSYSFLEPSRFWISQMLMKNWQKVVNKHPLCTVESWMKSWTSLVCIACAVWWIFKFKLSSIFKSIHFDTCIEPQSFAHKCAQLNSLLWSSCWDKILVNLRYFPTRFEPL